MAITTALAFKPTSAFAGVQGIHVTSTTQNHPLGTYVRAQDPIYGEGGFVYAKGVASTVIGDACTLDTGVVPATVRTVAASAGPIGIAMSANVASQYGWYQVDGAGLVASSAATINTTCGTSATAGTLVNSTTAVRVDGMRFTTAQDAPGSGFTGVQMASPTCGLDG